MILLINPRATRPENRRFPLSVMAVGAALPDDVSWEIVDGNLPGLDVVASVSALVEKQEALGDPVTAVALTVMPGPQLVSAVPLAKAGANLQLLVTKGKAQGYLTYEELNELLPDDAIAPDRLDALMQQFDELGIELLDEAERVWATAIDRYFVQRVA